MKPFRFSTAIMVPALLGLASPAAAQDWVSSMMQTTTDNMSYHAMTTAGTASLCAYDGVCSDSGESDGTASSFSDEGGTSWLRAAAQADSAGAAPVETAYSPDPSVTQNVEQDFYSAMRERDPQAAADVIEALQQYDMVAEFDEIVSPFGLHSGDLADAMAAYWVLNWMQVNGLRNEAGNYPARNEVVAARAQMARAMAAKPEIASMSEQRRQALAESLIYNFVFQHAVWTATSEPRYESEFAELSDAYRGHMQTMLGIDMRRLDLTGDGFVERG